VTAGPNPDVVDDDGFALECQHCHYRFPMDVTVGVLAAHFEAEHQTTDVKLDLAVVCRCDRSMTFVRAERNRDLFTCGSCHRTRVIKRKDR
jgi:hypothetical protein